jgi:hypothetical protein
MKTVDGKPEYRGAIDVIMQVAKNEGFFSLWKGFTPYYFREEGSEKQPHKDRASFCIKRPLPN